MTDSYFWFVKNFKSHKKLKSEKPIYYKYLKHDHVTSYILTKEEEIKLVDDFGLSSIKINPRRNCVISIFKTSDSTINLLDVVKKVCKGLYKLGKFPDDY